MHASQLRAFIAARRGGRAHTIDTGQAPISIHTTATATSSLTYSRLALALLAFGLAAPSRAMGQTREPEIARYRFVSDAATAGLWVNPGAAGFNRRVKLIGHYTWNRPREEGWTTAQYLVGLQSGVVGFGYRHDEFDDGPFSQGDAYTVSVGIADARTGLGLSRTWRTVGPAEGSWELGALARASDRVTLGLVWRDIGSPEVREETRESRLLAAVTVAPPKGRFSFSAQADYRTGGGGFRAFRIGGTAAVLEVMNGLAVAEWDGDGDFLGLSLGVQIRQTTGAAIGVVGLDSSGDARTASAGLLADVGQRP